MKYISLSFVIVFFFSGKIISQTDFRKGYIIKINNDTIYGLIDYKGNSANAKKCLFKKEASSEIVEFTPTELKTYRFIDSKYYVSKILNQSENAIFLEYLIDGIVDIYYYRDGLGEHYLADKGDGILYELKNKEKEVSVHYIINNNEYTTKYAGDSKEYIGTLRYVFDKSLRIGRKVENISLNHKSLINIANEYHKEVCLDEQCIVFEKKLPKIITTFGPIIGLNATSISLKNKFAGNLYYFQNSDFDMTIYPSIGLFFKVNLPYLNEKLHFEYEGMITGWKSETINSYKDPVLNMNYINDISLTQSIFNNSGIIRYEFPKGTLRPVFQAGCFVNYYFRTEYLRKTFVKSSQGDPVFSDETNENPFSKFDYGLCAGIGIIKKFNNRQLFLDLKYQRGFGLFKYLSTNSLLINAGIQLSK